MRILFYLPSYGKGGAATTQHWTELAEHLACKHYVFVRTPSAVITETGVEAGGVKISKLGGRLLAKISSRHLRELFVWCLMFLDAIFNKNKVDLVFCVDTPRFSILFGWLLKLRFGSVVIAWVKDLPLEQVVRRSGNPWLLSLARLLNFLSFCSFSVADRVVLIGTCMAKVLKSHSVPEQKISVIGDWAHDHSLIPLRPSLARKEACIPDLFTIMYLGFAAPWHDFDPIIEAIPKVISKHPVQFLFVGNGPGIDRVVKSKDAEAWENVIVKGWIPREELKKLPMSGDLHLATLKQNMIGTCSPSKTYTSMSFGRPTVFIGPQECQAAQDILNANSGRVVQNAEDLVAAVEDFLVGPEMLALCSRNARSAFLDKHSAQTVFKQWDDLIENVCFSKT